MSTAATAAYYPHQQPASSTSSASTLTQPSLPFHRRHLPATPIHTQQLPIPLTRPEYSPLSSGLPSPNFPSPIPLPAVIPSVATRGRSPAPSASSSRHPSRQQSIRRLSSISAYPPSRHPSINTATARRPSHAIFDHLDFSTIAEDILSEGDIIGQGDSLHGEAIQLVQIETSAPRPEQLPPAARLQVVRRLGAGSYAVVYLVREILSSHVIERPVPTVEPEELSDDSDENDANRYRHTYGREFAVKCLSKASLSPEELEIQMFEAKLHQSLPTHPNIITLYRTLQTPSFLLLILEFAPGEDLFYFLEQSRDSHPTPNDDEDYLLSVQPSRTPSRSSRPLPPVPGLNLSGLGMTPPTPSLLSTSNPQALLSYQRLRLIVSMFSQMCDAVDACHSQGVSHRDIKPENFIVTEGMRPGAATDRKVIVKLSDFGLATLLKDSPDVDCGSAPYMSYECRNNVAPTYATQPADVWSLGIVLINMLYHHNPWSDTATFATSTAEQLRHTSSSNMPSRLSTVTPSNPAVYICNSFSAFLASPVQFFLQRFPGMTYTVADFLANRVFCILPQPHGNMAGLSNVGMRVSARELGQWVKALPNLMGEGAGATMGGGLGSAVVGSGRPVPRSKLALEMDWKSEEEDIVDPHYHRKYSPPPELVIDVGAERDESEFGGNDSLRSPSAKRRGKRGARRKDKSQPPSTSGNPSSASLLDTTVPPTAAEVEQLASEISKTLRSSVSKTSVGSGKSRMSATERALARMPPMPQMAPPAPPSRASVESYRSIGHSLNDRERGVSPIPTPPAPTSPPPEPPRAAAVAIPEVPAPAPTATLPIPVIAPKKSWMGRFKFSNSNSSSTVSTPPLPAGHAAPRAHESPLTIMPSGSTSNSSLITTSSTTSSNVRSLISGLDSTRPSTTVRASTSPRQFEPVSMYSGLQWSSPEEELGVRRPRVNDLDVGSSSGTVRASSVRRPGGPGAQWTSGDEVGPLPIRSTRSPPQVQVPIVPRRALDRSWRSSMVSNSTTTSGTGTASSASSIYTRFDNASVRSVSTTATSVSGQSAAWRHAEKVDGPWRSHPIPVSDAASEAPPRPRKVQPMRTNVKRMDGVPRELDENLRYLQPRVKGVLQPPTYIPSEARKQHPAVHSHQQQVRSHRGSPPLDSISERNQSSPPPAPSPDAAAYRLKEAGTSTSDLDRPIMLPSTSVLATDLPFADEPRKVVHKAQSHTFQKMFSALKTNRRD